MDVCVLAQGLQHSFMIDERRQLWHWGRELPREKRKLKGLRDRVKPERFNQALNLQPRVRVHRKLNVVDDCALMIVQREWNGPLLMVVYSCG